MLFQWIAEDDDGIVLHKLYKTPGQKIVCLKYQGNRPTEIVVSKEDLEFFLGNPLYLKHIYNALKKDASKK